MREDGHSALVLDASRRASLSIIRSLGRKGINVTAADSRIASAGFLSKFARKTLRYPPTEDNVDTFCDFLLSHLRENSYDVLFPVHDMDLIPIARRRHLFEPLVRMVLPPQRAFETVLDKGRTASLAREVGIPTPETFTIDSLEELSSLPGRLTYPVVVKPRTQLRWTDNKEAVVSLVGPENYVVSGKSLTCTFHLIHERSPYPIVQERVTGNGAGVAAIFNQGEPRVLFSYRRLHEYPLSGGPSTLRISTEEPKLKKYAEMLLRALRWHGVAMVEFKVDDRTGQAWLIEVNGRFWGSLALPIAAGIDFPYLVYQLASQGDCPSVWLYRAGVMARWLIPGEALWLASSFRSDPSKIPGILKEFLTMRGIHYDYESFEDPLPAFGALLSSFVDGFAVLRGKRSPIGEYLSAG